MSYVADGRPGGWAVFADTARRKGNVLKAVILRDMRTRFFNHGLGFLVVPLWPLVHMLILLAIYTALGRVPPYGNTLYIFFATGLLPALSFMYISRLMAYSLSFNRPMLAFPVVKPLDLLIGRAALEIIGSFLTTFLILMILVILGDNPYPFDLVQAFYAYAATLFLAVSVGILAGVICVMNPMFITAYALFTVLIYLLSGIWFVPSALPQAVIDVVGWNPVLHCVEWMRVAYFEGYPSQVLSRSYVLGFGLTCLCLGLAIERMARGFILKN